jgi:hypothetical protein
MNHAETEAMLEFLNAARRGKLPGPCTGEALAARLLAAVAPFGDDLMVVDPTLRAGFAALLNHLAGPFDTDADKAAAYALLTP